MFENFNVDGEFFVKFDNQWVFCLGVVWDVFGDGEIKVWVSYGRYYLFIVVNMNICLVGVEMYI